MRVRHTWTDLRTRPMEPTAKPVVKRYCVDCGCVLNKYHRTHCYLHGGSEELTPEPERKPNRHQGAAVFLPPSTAPEAVLKAFVASDACELTLPEEVMRRSRRVTEIVRTYRRAVVRQQAPVEIHRDGDIVTLRKTSSEG